MSDEPDADGSETAANAGTQGGQGDHQGQPTGSQHNQGGGQPQRAPPQQYNTGPGIGDIFNRPETKTEMKVGTILFSLVAVGLGLAGFGTSVVSSGSTSGFGSGFGSSLIGGAMAMGAVSFVPLIALVVGLRQADVLADQPANILYANAAVTAFLGTLAAFVIGLLFFAISGGGQFLGDMIGQMIGPVVFAGLGAAVVGAGTVWTKLNFHAVPAGSQPREEQPVQQ